ncbi:MAG: hypothetical protein RLY71_87 [Pseudomonadota bacterium]|jgi:hypothetical protein
MPNRKHIDHFRSAIRKLDQLSLELESGGCFMITRLTVLKRLCADANAAGRFAGYLAERALQQLVHQPQSVCGGEVSHERFVALATEGVNCLKVVLAASAPELAQLAKLRSAYAALKAAQSEYRKLKWDSVRTIHCMPALTVEKALTCVLCSGQATDLAYTMARDFAERYDARYGTGLIPASAPFVREITEFWRMEWQRLCEAQ